MAKNTPSKSACGLVQGRRTGIITATLVLILLASAVAVYAANAVFITPMCLNDHSQYLYCGDIYPDNPLTIPAQTEVTFDVYAESVFGDEMEWIKFYRAPEGGSYTLIAETSGGDCVDDVCTLTHEEAVSKGTYNYKAISKDNSGDEDEDVRTIVFTNNPPVANFNGPFSGDEGIEITFSSEGTSDLDGDDLTYEWDFGDGETGTGASPKHTYADNGDYLVVLTVTDTDQAQDTDSATVTIANVAPANILVSNNGPVGEGSPVTVTVDSVTDVAADTFDYSFDWNSDGNYEVQNQDENYASHPFEDEGTYTVTVKVTDDDGGEGTGTTQVGVDNVAPYNIQITAPSTADEGVTVTFSGSAQDPGVNDVLTYTWDFGDSSPNETGQQVTHEFDDGLFTVRLTVDDGTDSGFVEHGITVIEKAPSAALSGDASLDEGEEGDFDASGSTPDQHDAIASYEWDWDYSGSFDASGDTGATQSHAWDADGGYTVAVRVTDVDGSWDIETLGVTVDDVGVTADFEYAPQYPDQTTTVYFTDKSVFGPDGPKSWSWDFDDGSTSTDQNTSHQFAEGEWNVTLTVEDNGGSTDSITRTVTVSFTNLPPTTPASVFANGVLFGGASNVAHLTCTGSSDPNGHNIFYTMDAYYSGGWNSVVADDDDGEFDWDVTGIATQSDVELRCKATDELGADSPQYAHSIENLSIDWSAPTTTLSGTTGAWQNTHPNITLDATDSGDAGVSTITYCTGAADCTPGTAYTGLFQVSAEGESWVRYRANDTLGNLEAVKSQAVRIDTQAPDTDDDYAYNGTPVESGQTIMITPSDPEPSSGLAWTRYCTTDTSGGCDPETEGADYTDPVQISSMGTTYLRYASADTAGNVQAVQEVEVIISAEVPLITDDYASSGTWVNSNQTVMLTPTAPDGYTIETVKWCTGVDCNVSEGTVLESPYRLDFTGDQDTVTVRYQCWDNASRASGVGQFVVMIDQLLPSFGVFTSPNVNESTVGNVTVSADVTDALSGVNSSAVTLFYRHNESMGYVSVAMANTVNDTYEGTIPEPTGGWAAQAGETMSWYVEAEDLAGNMGASNFQTDLIETGPNTPPVVDLSALDGYEVPEDTFDDSIDLNDYVTDEDPASLVWACSSEAMDIQVSVNGSTLEINATNNVNGLFNISCTATDTGGLNGTDAFELNVTPVNDEPVLGELADTHIAWRSYNFYLDVDATDIDSEDLTFSDDTDMFDIDPETGVILFAPNDTQVGAHTVTVTVSDGELNDSKELTFNIYVYSDSEASGMSKDKEDVYVGDTVQIGADIGNKGHFAENFTVYLKDNSAIVGTQTLELNPDASQHVTFDWTPTENVYHTLTVEVAAVYMEDDVTNNRQSLQNVRVWSAAEVIDTSEFKLEFSQDPVTAGSDFQLRFKLKNMEVTEDFEDFPVHLNVPDGITLSGNPEEHFNLTAGYNQYRYRNLTAGSAPGNYTFELVGGNNEVVDTAVIEVI